MIEIIRLVETVSFLLFILAVEIWIFFGAE